MPSSRQIVSQRAVTKYVIDLRLHPHTQHRVQYGFAEPLTHQEIKESRCTIYVAYPGEYISHKKREALAPSEALPIDLRSSYPQESSCLYTACKFVLTLQPKF